MSTTHPIDMTALEQARLVREGAVSSAELVAQTLDRIRSVDPTCRAFVAVFDRAIESARRKDRERLRTRGDLPPFHGVPIGIKDLNVVRWQATRFGSRAMPSLPLPVDDYTVAPLRRAHAESLSPGLHRRRVERRVGRRRRRRHARGRPGLRRRRVDPHSLVVLPALRAQARAGPVAEPVRPARPAAALHLGTDHAH
jgi:hypothetical protein